MHRWRNQLTVSIVAALLGLLVVVQLHTQQASSALAGLTAQELTVLVANLNAHNEELRREIVGLDAQLSDLTGAESRGETSVDQIKRDLARVRAWAGLEPLSGPGIAISVSGPIAGPGVEDVLNELHNAGAEAIAVDTVRVVPGSVVAGPAGGLSIENTVLDDPFQIRAIGSPESLTGSLTRMGGVLAQLSATYPSAVLTVTPMDMVNIPASARSLIPTNGGPRL
jgi:uncharacterized protein YlxW (UPF0749 family)